MPITFEEIYAAINPAEDISDLINLKSKAVRYTRGKGANVERLLTLLGYEPRDWSTIELMEIAIKLGIRVKN